MARRPSAKPDILPVRLKIPSAAQRLQVSVKKMRDLKAQGVFTIIKDKDGKFSTQYIPTDEIDAYALGGVPAVEAVRLKNNRG